MSYSIGAFLALTTLGINTLRYYEKKILSPLSAKKMAGDVTAKTI